jgi:hypothetical protein
LLLPNFVFEGKNEVKARTRKRPVNLQLDWRKTLGEDWGFYTAADLDFPSEVYYSRDGFSFDFEKYRAWVGGIWSLSPRKTLWTELFAEHADKLRRGKEPDDPEDLSTDREVVTARTELIGRAPEQGRWSVGYKYIFFGEDRLHRNDPAATVLVDRDEHIAYGTWTYPWRRYLHVTNGAYLEWLNLRERRPGAPEKDDRNEGLHAKWSLVVEWLGEQYRVAIAPTWEVDAMRFGGGFAHVYIEF